MTGRSVFSLTRAELTRTAATLAAILCLLTVAACSSPSVHGGRSPAHTETLAAGPYAVDANLYQDPPITDRPVKVTVAPHGAHLRLSGYIVVFPGLGTDAVPIRSALSRTGATDTLTGTIRMPVRGAWEVRVQLTGPRGAGDAMFLITVAAPGAVPVWVAWIIGVTPLLIVAYLIWHAARYRRTLLMQRSAEAVF